MMIFILAMWAAVLADDWKQDVIRQVERILAEPPDAEGHAERISSVFASDRNRDQFNIEMLFPSTHPDTDWFASWDQPRRIDKSNVDDIGDRRAMSRGNGSLTIGLGELIMDGDEPRYYVRAPDRGWTNTEFTVYCRLSRISNTMDCWLVRSIPAQDCLILLNPQSRSYPEAGIIVSLDIHADPCDARGYYARFYFHKHRIQLKKEFRHDPNGTVIYSHGIETIRPLDPDFDVLSHYVGMKSVVTSNPGASSEGADGGDWKLLLDYSDENLEALLPTDCICQDGHGHGDSSPIFRPGQVSILRADAVQGLHLRSASIRAI